MGMATRPRARRGVIVVLAAVILVMLFAFTAFTVDLGYVALTRSQLQNAADAAALAAAGDLVDALGSSPVRSTSYVAEAARTTAERVGASNSAGNHDKVFIDGQDDVELGQTSWNSKTKQWQVNWGALPATAIRVTVSRGGASRGDGLPLFFAPVLGHDTAAVRVEATAAVFGAENFHIPPGSPLKTPMLPIVCDEDSWKLVEKGAGPDQFAYDPDSKSVRSGSDGTAEIDIYPGSNKEYPPGNRGLVSLGAPTSDSGSIRHWILEGMDADDMDHFGGEIGNDSCPLMLDGVPGMKSDVESALRQIIGQPRIMPVFANANGSGTNAKYRIVRFVGVRILDVELNGGQKRLIVQPATVVDATAVPGDAVSSDFYTTPRLIQ